MLFAMLAASLLTTMPPVDGATSLGNPNYAPSSVHIGSVSNPMYSFPSNVGEVQTINGRIYKGTAIIGGVDVGPKTDLARAAASYGAYGDEGTRIRADVQGLFRYNPTTTVEMSPWVAVTKQRNSPVTDSFSRGQEKIARRAEEARQQWLADNNFTGGVRTMVNDAELYPVPPAAKKTEAPQPRGVIELSPDTPAFRSRMHVMGTVHAPAMRTASSDLIKVVKPVEAPKAEAAAPKAEEKPAEPAEKVAAK